MTTKITYTYRDQLGEYKDVYFAADWTLESQSGFIRDMSEFLADCGGTFVRYNKIEEVSCQQ